MSQRRAAAAVIPAVFACFLAGCGGGTAGPVVPVETVAPVSGITTSPSSLSFASLGASAMQSLQVTEKGYSGTFTESDTCSAYAKVATSSPTGPSTFFQVTPMAIGSCTVTVFDSSKQQATTAISVAPAPTGVKAFTASPTALSFTASGAGAAQTFSASETGYSGLVNETDTCANIASVAPTAGTTGSSVPFKVTASATGSCLITVSDSNKQTANVSVTVSLTPPPSAPGLLATNPTALSFTSVGNSATRTFAATESGYTGAISEADTCSGIAVVAATSGITGANIGFMVTPTAAGACSITVSDSFGQKASVSILVTTTGLVVQ